MNILCIGRSGRRPAWIGAVLAIVAIVGLVASARAEPSAKKRRLIFNWDGAMTYMKRNPLDKKPFDPWPISQEQFLSYVVDPFMSKPVDSIFYCMSSGNVFTTRMETGERIGQYLKGGLPTGSDGVSQYVRTIVPQCRRFWSEGTDGLEMVVGRVHKAGREVFASFRMNDAHFTWSWEIEWCKFNRDNPQFTVGGPRTQFDYAHQEVRDWRFRHIEEICRKWDVDGVELDFLRHPPLFKQPVKRAQIMTQFVGRVKKLLDELGRKRGRPILLAVRTHENQEFSLGIGLDVNEWIRRGWLDLLVAGGGYMVADQPIEGFVKTTGGTRCQVYACLNNYKADPITRAWAANSWAKGASGLYLFNWCDRVTYDNIESPVWEQIAEPSNLVGTSKLFLAENRRCDSIMVQMRDCYGDKKPTLPLPIQLSDKPAGFEILACEDIQAAASVPNVSLWLTIKGKVDADDLTVHVNGRQLKAGKMPSTQDRRALVEYETVVPDGKILHPNKCHKPTHELPVPADALLNGRNRVEITLASGQTATLVSAAIFVDYSTKP